MNAEGLLLLVSSTLFLCYVSGLFYARTKVPDIVWLLGFGMLLGPVLHVFDAEQFIGILPTMLLVTVSLFSFDSGIKVDLQLIKESLGKSLALAVASFTAITLAAGLALRILMPSSFDLLRGLTLGAMIGGSGGVALSAMLGSLGRLLKNIDGASALLTMESTIVDPIRVVAVVSLIRMAMLPQVSLREGARDLLFTFVASAFMGLAVGLAWGEALNRLRGRPLNYMMTMATLFPAYITAEYWAGAGGGPVAVLVFGMVLMNYGYVTKSLGWKRSSRIDRGKMREYHDEVTFLVKSLFFVHLGLIVSITPGYALAGLVLLAIALTVRHGVVSALGRFLGFTRPEAVLSRSVFIQGAGVLILSQMPYAFDPDRVVFQNPDIFPSICLPVVLGTILFSSVLAPMIARRTLKENAVIL